MINVDGLNKDEMLNSVKPFETMKLLVRIEVVLRRFYKGHNLIKFKNNEVNLESRTVKLNNSEVYLTTKEYDLIISFLQKNLTSVKCW